MTVLDVVKYGDPLLTQPTKVVEVFDDSVEQLGIDLLETMRAANGGGMAANMAAFVGLACALRTSGLLIRLRRILIGLAALAVCHPLQFAGVAVVAFSLGGKNADLSATTIGNVINVALAFVIWAALWREELLGTLTSVLKDQSVVDEEKPDESSEDHDLL